MLMVRQDAISYQAGHSLEQRSGLRKDDRFFQSRILIFDFGGRRSDRLTAPFGIRQHRPNAAALGVESRPIAASLKIGNGKLSQAQQSPESLKASNAQRHLVPYRRLGDIGRRIDNFEFKR